MTGFGTGGVAGLGNEDAAEFCAGGVVGALLASEFPGDCPRTVAGPKLTSQIAL